MRGSRYTKSSGRGNFGGDVLATRMRSLIDEVSARLWFQQRHTVRTATRRTLGLEWLEPRQLLTGDPVITEFMARNDGGLEDGDGKSPDWIEILNAGDETIDLAGYRLTNNIGNPDKWVFPSVEVGRGEYLVVFASGKDVDNYVDPAGNLHTNFTLRRSGDYIGLLAPDGSVVSAYDPGGSDFPEQVRNVSYGFAQKVTVIDATSDVHYTVPLGDMGMDWTQPDFDALASGFSTGKASLGYESRPTDRNNFIGQFETTLPEGVHALYTRFEFTLNDASAATDLLLRLKYDNGYVAYLNGVEVGQDNAPPNPAWFSTALSGGRPRDSQAIEFQEFNLSDHVGDLRDGTNVLAIHLLNNLNDDSDMLLAPKLIVGVADMRDAVGIDAEVGFMPEPTPGAPNGSNSEVFAGFLEGTEFSVDHGFFNEPLQVELTSEQEDVEIRYTTDGSTPSASNGTLYEGPITISESTTLRAAAVKADFIPSRADTRTYLFLEDVLQQSPNGEAPPGFPDGTVAGQQLDYGMDPEIVNDPVWGPQLIDALTQVPTISMVTNVEHLFDARTGIYTHAGQHGEEWERPGSIELINPDGSPGFQINAGIRIRGGFSRTGTNPKHAFRLFFNNDYDGALEFPLFQDEGVDQFKKMDLRTTQNYSWAFQGNPNNTFLRDAYSRDVQGAMGHAYTRSRYYHLYINGHYWGLFQTQERSEAAFAESYFGGDRDDYDTVKHQVEGGRRSEATDGTLDAFFRLHEATVKGYENNQDYYRVQGMNPDGSRNSDFERLVDVDNLIDYMIITYFTGDSDGPGSRFTGPAPNNYFGILNRENPDGFKWFEHDSEHSLNTSTGPNMVTPLSINHNAFRETNRNNFNPHWLHEVLMKNEEYRLRFADRVQLHFFNGGILTTEESLKLIDDRIAQFDVAIIAESARWGDGSRARPFTKDDWLRAVETTRNWFDGRGGRVNVVIDQLRDQARLRMDFPYFPTIDAPRFNLHGGVVPQSFEVEITADQGAIYYTTDGSDPRLVEGDISSAALVYSDAFALTEGRTVKARVLHNGEWSAIVEADFPIQSQLPLRISEINYHPHTANLREAMNEQNTENDNFEFVELINTGNQTIDLEGVQFVSSLVRSDTQGIGFTFAGQSLEPQERIVVVRNRVAFQSRYGDATRIAAGSDGAGGPQGQFGGRLADKGERIKLIDAEGSVIHQFDYDIDGEWPARAAGQGSSLEVVDLAGNYDEPSNWRNSSEFGGSPGETGRSPAIFIKVSEVLANSQRPQGDMIELHSIIGTDVNIGGWYLTDTNEDYFKYRVPANTIIPILEYHTISEAELGFGFSGARGGQVWLISADADGRPLRFEDQVEFGHSARGLTLGPWPSENHPFVVLAKPTLGSRNSGPWIADVVISEVHYNPTDPDGAGRLRAKDFEFIELYNRSIEPVDISGWGLAGDIQFTFPEGTVLESRQALPVVGFNPTDRSKPNVFRFTMGISLSVSLSGPYSDPLDDTRGLIRLVRPGEPTLDEPDLTPIIVMDELAYDSTSPWPSEPAGTGDSLTRTQPSDFGRFPTSWRSRTPSPGIVQLVVRNPGDANEDGQFDQLDIQQVLAAGKYATRAVAGWSEGDWTGNGKFDQRDIVLALQTGTYLKDPLAARQPLPAQNPGSSFAGGSFREDTVDAAMSEEEIATVDLFG